jgi:hypothetical protein
MVVNDPTSNAIKLFLVFVLIVVVNHAIEQRLEEQRKEQQILKNFQK